MHAPITHCACSVHATGVKPALTTQEMRSLFQAYDTDQDGLVGSRQPVPVRTDAEQW